MVFSSLLFVFAFLVPQLALYFLIRNTKARNIILLFFSLIFYAFGGPKFVILLVGEAFVSWFTAKRIGKTAFPEMKKRWLIVELVFMLSLLGVFKYLGFFLDNIRFFTGWPETVPQIILPIGISFYTFQLISYVIDVYRGDVEAQPAYWKVLLYASLFHQCIAGPIVRYQTVAAEIEDRKITLNDVTEGVRRFSVGLAKKAILANGCADIADKLLPEAAGALVNVSSLSMWLGMLAYMLQIYLDFSAYSDMAIGMGRMVGFHYLENFDYPYSAHTVQGFWRKWHISLSTFFRDYVYIPLGGSRKGTGRTIFNMLIVWFLTGMWHGASWNFILWGLYFFIFLTLERLFLSKLLEKNLFTRIIGHVYTLIVVYFGWVLFRFTDINNVFETVKGLCFSGHALYGIETESALLNKVFFLALAIIACFPLGKVIEAVLHKAADKHDGILLHMVNIIDAFTPALLVILSVLALVGNSYNPFLYFRF